MNYNEKQQISHRGNEAGRRCRAGSMDPRKTTQTNQKNGKMQQNASIPKTKKKTLPFPLPQPHLRHGGELRNNAPAAHHGPVQLPAGLRRGAEGRRPAHTPPAAWLIPVDEGHTIMKSHHN